MICRGCNKLGVALAHHEIGRRDSGRPVLWWRVCGGKAGSLYVGRWHAFPAQTQVPMAQFLDLCPRLGQKQEAEWGCTLLGLPAVLPLMGCGGAVPTLTQVL